MKNIKIYLFNEGIEYEESRYEGQSNYLKFMIGQQIYLVTDYGNHYELESINQDMHFEAKNQKAIVMILTNLKEMS